ncbi:hypothetical protein MA16_Dca022499 [Dendrobium catenatum]|uniref:Uncharacterized protein n=1 Tax=Dendrobium catenatum TaxID=906689 RepID=A0A2I0VTF7_9ASPA|nr:hypothetical protein MA16_Dca022499 [Dendrobium catenatum]
MGDRAVRGGLRLRLIHGSESTKGGKSKRLFCSCSVVSCGFGRQRGFHERYRGIRACDEGWTEKWTTGGDGSMGSCTWSALAIA